MDDSALDRTDMAILHLLQEDARDTTTEEIAEQVDLAASTVASRIQDLERSGVITDYVPTIDYERAGFDQHLLVVGTITGDDDGDGDDCGDGADSDGGGDGRSADDGDDSDGEDSPVASDLMDVDGVVNVRELATDENNVFVELVSASQSDAEAQIDDLSERGVEVTRTEFLTRELQRPFAEFGSQFAADE